MTQQEIDQFSINIVEFLRHYGILNGDEISYGDELHLDYDNGAISIKHKLRHGGTLSYSTMIHPNNGLCETEPFGGIGEDGLCCWCGRTLL